MGETNEAFGRRNGLVVLVVSWSVVFPREEFREEPYLEAVLS